MSPRSLTGLAEVGPAEVAPAEVGPSEAWPLRAAAALAPDVFASVRRTALLRHCKWDAQVGDQATLAPFPLILERGAAATLAGWAERLDAEARAAEQELLGRPELWETLAVPRAIRAVLRRGRAHGFTRGPARVMRFDFHPSTEGWRLSEVNADVPGGFSEATELTRLVADACPGLAPTGAPGPAWVDAMLAGLEGATRDGARAPTVALLHAPGFIEDLQVVSYLAGLLRARGAHAILAQPQHLVWREGHAHLETDWHRGPVDLVVRFFQAEWLSRLPRSVAWQPHFVGSRTPVANPGLAVLLESKRLPLVWDRLTTALPTWRALLPETRALRGLRGSGDASWVLKSAYSNNGDDVLHRETTPEVEYRKATRWMFLARGEWLEQRRFSSVPVATPWGDMHACLGVYTVNGRAVGTYGRLSRGPVVDYRAVDAAVLIEERT